MKKITLLIALLFTSFAFSQDVSDYKYIIVPKKFSFLKEANMYNLNALTKTVFENQGYEVYYDGDVFPQELAENRCRALFADMLENNTLLSTKIKIELKDCRNQVVYVSEEGVSREKDYAKGYVQAFRTVGKSLEILKSKPNQDVVKMPVKTSEVIQPTVVSAQLFAQPILNGFQLVDSSPKVVMKLLKTSKSNFYIGQKENQQGVVFNSNNQWVFEYYQNDKLVSEKLEIKF
ncbi:hypothetical protein FEDK69T_20740 [Flavobacterium enshiense DK69]|uniref:Beta-lactamase-inhibitor-like PepSY-like domain-containing protein n=1 Tax=Flavobacterium enshiense DK69 TaxID=1107311 RepID=V6S5X1_9FLAO|nr:hypothetical protein [Flavobacterium enshiense]ESU22098.1 hypothetical protein FEDK69T_20740 [Flavobacterium enshiense DK69]KGO97111.1 hypothetical protein Q767_00470 [Flavobacterium enshiense DK69]